MLEESAPWLAPGYRTRLGRTADLVLQADSADSFILCSEDDVTSFASFKLNNPDVIHTGSTPGWGVAKSKGTPSVRLRVHRRPDEKKRTKAPESESEMKRPASAQAVFGRPYSALSSRGSDRVYSGRARRPTSARVPTGSPQRPSSARVPNNSPRRPGSARPPSSTGGGWCAGGDNSEYRDTQFSEEPLFTRTSKKTFALVNRLYEDEESRQAINLHPHPHHRYFSRHSRCYDYSHMHTELLRSQPQTACDGLSRRIDDAISEDGRPVSAASGDGRLLLKVRRFIDCHRPRSATSSVGTF